MRAPTRTLFGLAAITAAAVLASCSLSSSGLPGSAMFSTGAGGAGTGSGMTVGPGAVTSSTVASTSVTTGSAPMLCNPGETKNCYGGPMGTENVGTCMGGAQMCNAEGSAYGACEGEVLPGMGVEDCATGLDTSCTGKPPVCTGMEDWGKSYGDSNDDGAWAVAVDAKGNVAVTGSFSQGCSGFDVGPKTLMSNGGEDVFVVELDSTGKYLWSTSFGSSNDDQGLGIAFGSDDSVYVVGASGGSFDAGNGHSITGSGGFLVKLAANDGSCAWAVTLDGGGNGGSQVANGVAVAPGAAGATDTLWVTGSFTSAVSIHNRTVSSLGGSDIFVAVLDSGGNLEALDPFGDGDDQFGNAVATDSQGNGIIAGGFRGSITFGQGMMLTSAGNLDAYVAKLSVSGGMVAGTWADRYGDQGHPQEARSVAVAVAAPPPLKDDILIAGDFKGSFPFGSSMLADNGNGNYAAFVGRVSAGGASQWGDAFSVPNGDQFARGIAVDLFGNVVVTGGQNGSLSVDNNSNVETTDGNDVFLTKLDPTGKSLLFTLLFGDSMSDQLGTAVAVDATAHIVLAGAYQGDCGTLSNLMLSAPNAGGYDAFLARLEP